MLNSAGSITNVGCALRTESYSTFEAAKELRAKLETKLQQQQNNTTDRASEGV